MMIVEMHNDNPGKRQYVWLRGQQWPVPQDEDVYVMRVEVFGPEFGLVCGALPTGRMMEHANAPLMDWRFPDASYISELMREFARQQAPINTP